MARLYTDSGADRLFKGGLVGGGVTVRLHTADSPTTGNTLSDAWYSNQDVAEADWTPETSGTYRELNNDDDIVFGKTPDAGALSDVQSVGIWKGTTLLWYDDTMNVDIVNGRTVKINAGALRLQINKTNSGI